MNDFDYRSGLKRYSNSDLSELSRVLFGKSGFNVSQAALNFGTHFHKMVLEPGTATETDTAQFTALEYYHLCQMYLSFRADKELAHYVDYATDRETVRQWDCPLTGLPLKAKLDAVVLPKRVHLIDLKTTSCRSKGEFIDTCVKYDYDRQAAFYLSSDPEARFFEFVGVQKQAPYNLYRAQYHKSDEFIQNGKRKMDLLLRSALAESQRVGGWRPSAWSRTESVNL